MRLDLFQKNALDICVSPCRVSVVGAPGTGKTQVAKALVVREAIKGKKVVLLSPDRRAAGELANSVTSELGSLPESVNVQSLVAFAYKIVSEYAHSIGRKPPELLTGPDEDAILADILEDPEVSRSFPQYVDEEVCKQSGFRSQMRDFITCATELGLRGSQVRDLGRERQESMWVAGGELMEIYEDVLAARDSLSLSDSPDRLGHAHLVGAAAAILSQWDTENIVAHLQRPRWDWVVVDDIHNAPRSILGLLEQLSADGASIVVMGSPDSAVQGFRGGAASLPGEVCARGFTPVSLKRSHRAGRNISVLARKVEENIRVSGGAISQRCPEHAEGEDEVRALRFAHEEEEAAGISGLLRRAHVEKGIPYSAMAVVTRSRSMHAHIRASLVRHEIPLENLAFDRPLREQKAVEAILELIRLVIEPENVDDAAFIKILSGCLLSISPLRIRQIGRILRGHELVMGGRRSEIQLLRSAVLGGEETPQGLDELEEVSRVLSNVRQTIKNGGQAEEVLWAAWDGCHKAEQWQRIALGKGLEADSANADLDAIMQLFRVAQRLADRRSDVTIHELIEDLKSHQLPEDSIARMGTSADAVVLTTPNASMGREWEYVVIAGLQDGLWPNMRARDSLTHTSELVQIVLNRETEGLTRIQERSAVMEEILDDELRQFLHAITRSTRHLVLTCVESEEHTPSRFFSLVGCVREEMLEVLGAESSEKYSFVLESPRPAIDEFDAASLVAELRRSNSADRDEMIESLAQAGVVQAERKRWADACDFTPSLGLPPHAPIVISPSRVERLLDCPLQAFLSDIGGEESGNRPESAVGTLIHELAELFAQGNTEGIWEIFEEKWEKLHIQAKPLDYQRIRARAVTSLKGLESYLMNSEHDDVEVELEVSRQYPGGITVKGVIDRLEKGADGSRIVDFKTGKAISKEKAKTNLQLQLYQSALQRKDMLGARLVYVRSLTAQGVPVMREQFPLGEEDNEAVHHHILEAARLLREKNFAAYPDDRLCSNCSFSSLCPAMQEGRVFS